MVGRQILLGVSGGTALAFLALFLTIPRAVIVDEAPAWLLRLLPEAEVSVEGEEPAEIPSHPFGKEPGVPKLQSEGVRVASLGVGFVDASSEPPPVELEEVEEEQALPSRPARADELDPNLYMAALSKQTIIRKEAKSKATIIGFARTGALLRRAPIASGHQGCKGGWYRVEPDGYICAGPAATLDPEHPVVGLASLQPDRSRPMPYAYGTSRYPTPPLYTKIPNEEEEQRIEQDIKGHKRKGFGDLWGTLADAPPPQSLAAGQRIPRPFGYPDSEQKLTTGRALASSSFAFIDMFESRGRKWGLTADFSLLPLDRLTPVKASKFSGVVVESWEDFPIVFVRSHVQHLYEGSPSEGTLKPTRAIAFREAFHLTGEEVKVHGTRFLETRDGAYIKQHGALIRVEARESMPKWAKKDRSWIEVSILNQSLIAYRGKQPVFATLVSTGKDGLGDPETTHSTVQGMFLIHTKHVSSTMSGDVVDDEFDLRDVPYVQYFHGGYAFHAAFWHDGFGQPRSHGCVNLSPSDARHLFSVTEPPVPLPWHSALDTRGTLVYIHP